MYLSIRKEKVKGLPKRFQESGVKLFPRVAVGFNGKYEQTWKFNNEGNYSMAKREPKWKYKIYLCGSYRVDSKVRNKQILLETIYYWDIVDKYINVENKPGRIWNSTTEEYTYYTFEEGWLNFYFSEDMSGEVYKSIAEWLGDSSHTNYTMCRLITNKLSNEIEGIREDYKTTSEYKINKENQEIIENCIKEAEWLNKENGFE